MNVNRPAPSFCNGYDVPNKIGLLPYFSLAVLFTGAYVACRVLAAKARAAFVFLMSWNCLFV